MKMKIRAEGKDVLKFALLTIGLFIVVSLLVLNVTSLTHEGVSHGFNFFPIFISGQVWPTLAIVAAMLIIVTMSLKSRFYEKDKGFGISLDKGTKGFSRWAKKKEIKAALEEVNVKNSTIDSAGIPLWYEGDTIYVDDDNSHSLVIGSTGSGKTWGFVMTMIKLLSKKGESMVLTDPKGELYQKTSNILREQGYNVVVLNLRNPQEGNAWNPLMLPYRYFIDGNSDKATELLDDLAINILYEQNNGNADPFWEKSSANYFAGIALGLFDDAKPEEINLNSINVMSTIGEEKYGGSTYIKEYFNMKDPSKPAYINASGIVMAAEETKQSILAVFKQKIKIFSSKENLSEMLSHSDFDMGDIGREKTAVFIVIQDEKKTYHPLATTFVKQCYENLIDVAHENGGALPIRTNFILDEFANMPPLQDVSTMITAARSRHIRFNLIIQNFSQLDQVYGKENAETIKGNCKNLLYLLSGELKALEEISKLCGDRKVKTKSGEETRPLISVTELQTLPMWTGIVKKQRMNPYKIKITPAFKLDFNENKSEDAEYVVREKKDLAYFDIKEFVKTKKRESMLESFKKDDDSPFGKNNGMPDIPPMRPERPKPNKPMFDIDDLVKRIDAKIAEIDKEEEEPKTVETKLEESIPEAKPVEKKQEETVVVEENIETTPTVNSDVTDDQFFDDFFID
jgi:type IV secretory pathway TraG/TraD family ATPase VirD4